MSLEASRSATVAERQRRRLLPSAVVVLGFAGTGEFEAVGPSTVVRPGDRIVIAGRKENVERFALHR